MNANCDVHKHTQDQHLHFPTVVYLGWYVGKYTSCVRKACHNDKHSVAIWLTKQIIHNRQEENTHLLVQEEEVWELHHAYSLMTNLFVQLRNLHK